MCSKRRDNGDYAWSIQYKTYYRTKQNTTEANLYNAVCSQNETWCLGSTTNATVGKYGAFSVCNSTERVSWILNQLYKSGQNDTAACTSRRGVVKMAEKSQSKQCQFLLRQAGPEGTGTVTQAQLPDELLREVKQPGNSTISTSAKAGIGVSITLLFLFAAGIFLLQRRRKRKFSNDDSEKFEKAELPDTSAALPKNEIFEIDGDDRKEIGDAEVLETGHEMIIEMPTTLNEPVELEARRENQL
jgi:hypothetical protein